MKLKEVTAKILRITKQNFRWIVVIFMLLICFVIVENLFDNEIYIFDDYVYKYISIIISPKMTMFLKMITSLGSAITVTTLCVLSFVFLKDKIYGKVMTLNLVIITVINMIIKNIVSRPRPTGFRIIDETGYSFPSGHSMVSMAFYGLIIFLVYRYVKNNYFKWTLISIFSILVFLIGISRIYLGVHYASDVVEGFCISIAYLILFVHVLTRNKIFAKN
ncbi:MAG: phosphoesterase PA-phosphatase related [Clostridia bacterium]|jgi:undecaprenyl-diphosphatase|nr:phosphoesterase PA-phosphatase related [Clostridia bacterium]